MANLTVTNTFQENEPARAAEVNANFTDVRTFVNTQVVHKDGTNPFTVMPILPSSVASGVNTAATAANKAYVDDRRWNTAWGVVAVASSTTPQTFNSDVYADAIGLSVSAMLVNGRRYLLRVYAQAIQVSATGFVAELGIWNEARTVQYQYARKDIRNTNDEFTLAPSRYFAFSDSSAVTTFRLRGRCSVASTSWRTDASGSNPVQFVVEDVGPV